MTDEGPPDPISALTESATQLHELFSAYVDAGFTRHEALQLVIEIIRPHLPGR